jgi:hypothetical protein
MKGFRLYNVKTIQSLFSQTEGEKRRVIAYNGKEVVFVKKNFRDDYYYINILEVPEELKGLIVYKGEVVLNYPKIRNVNKLEPSFIYQEKYNGTNVGLFKLGKETLYRTRGSLNPSSVYNDVMNAIAENKEVIIPFSKEETGKIKEKFKPIFEACLKKEYLMEDGYLDMKNVMNYILSNYGDEVEELLGKYDVVFGELVSACNPIIVDFELKRGFYNTVDPDLILFDVGYVDEEGDYYLSYEFEVKKMKKAKLYQSTEIPGDVEGFMLKSDHGYYKYKPDDVLKYVRIVAKVQTNPYEYFDMVVSKIYQEGSLFLPTSKEELDTLVVRVREETSVNGFDDVITEVLYKYIIHAYLKEYGKVDGKVVSKMREEVYIPFDNKRLGRLIGKAIQLKS